MRLDVEVERIEQVLHVQAGVGVALDRELALEEQRVGIFLARGELEERGQASADDHRGIGGRGRHQLVAQDPEGDTVAGILDVQLDRAALELDQPRGDRLAAQQVREHARRELGVQGIRQHPQREVKERFEQVHEGGALCRKRTPLP
jgi:hypothetical protein